MMKYLIVLLCDTSVSFCYYQNTRTTPRLMHLETLKRAIRYAMCENMLVQFIYPEYQLPPEYDDIIESIDHVKIAPPAPHGSDIVVLHSLEDHIKAKGGETISIRLSIQEFPDAVEAISHLINFAGRVNIALTDTPKATDNEITRYSQALDKLSDVILEKYRRGHRIQFNLLTDRLMLLKMNNCNAGHETITIAPDGNFYVCPAFYLNNDSSVGNPDTGIQIPNQQLYRLDRAPICLKCDAWHCRRCVWLNKITTWEVNTPGHGQCVVSHVEREAARKLLGKLREIDESFANVQIEKLNYTDPFETSLHKFQ